MRACSGPEKEFSKSCKQKLITILTFVDESDPDCDILTKTLLHASKQTLKKGDEGWAGNKDYLA